MNLSTFFTALMMGPCDRNQTSITPRETTMMRATMMLDEMEYIENDTEDLNGDVNTDTLNDIGEDQGAHHPDAPNDIGAEQGA